MKSSNLSGALFALAGFAIFASHDAVVKALGATYSTVQIVFFSVLLGFPIVTMILIGDTTGGSLRPRRPWWMALRTGAVVVAGVTAFYAFSHLPLAQTYAIIFTTPLIITVLSIPVLGEKVGPRRWMAVIVGLIGVIVVVRPGAGAELELGHLAALVAAVSGALVSVIMRKIGNEERSVALLFYPMVANFVVMGLALPFVYKPMPLLDLAGLGIIALFAVLAMLCMIVAYRQGEAVVVAPMQYSQILWAALYGLIIFDEIPDAGTIIGSAIIIGSGLFILLREGRGGVSRNRPVLRTGSRIETGTYPRISAMLQRHDRGE